MKISNYEYLRDYDKFKDQVFRSKIDQHKNKLKIKDHPNNYPEKVKISSIIPWKLIVKATLFTGIIYLAYNNSQVAKNYLITKGYLNPIDFLALQTIQADFIFRIKSILKNSKQNKHFIKQKFANNFYKAKLEQHDSYLKATFQPYVIKSQINSVWKIWILNFKNEEKCFFVNQFGDVQERHQTSKIRLWNYPIWKDTTDKIISIQPTLKQYQYLYKDKNEQKQNPISQVIVKNCQKVNFFNKFSKNYLQIMKQCKQISRVGVKIDQYLKKRFQFIEKNHKESNNQQQKLSFQR